ncbi:hypothetical protein [Siphonobacter sp.]|uniref:hypothetical protein n=1 Tax=Siphonobacter sp. TaxID=1869184 RepID=UPI003B3B531A
MSQLQSNLSQHWNRYLVVIALIVLAILKNRNVLTSDDVINIQYALYTLGIIPSDPRQIPKTIIRPVIRRVRKVTPLLLLFVLSQCKPASKPVTPGDLARVQVKKQITRTYEKVVVAVDAMPDDQLSKLVTSDSETVKLFEQYYRADERTK